MPGICVMCRVAEFAARVAELALHLATQEHNRGDDGESDERDEEECSTMLAPRSALENLASSQVSGRKVHACPFVANGCLPR